MQRGPGIRVMLVDRQRIVLSGLQKLVDAEKPAMEVVATATSIASAVQIAPQVLSDVVVLDSGLLREDRPSDIASLANGQGARVLVLGETRESPLQDSAVLRGACGVVLKEEAPEVLFKAIAKVHEGQLWLDRSTTGRLFVELSRQKSAADPAKRKLATLTEREQDVVRSIVKQPGADNKTLATTLHIGEHTLRNHLSRIYDKLGVPNRLELYVFAQRHVVQQQPATF